MKYSALIWMVCGLILAACSQRVDTELIPQLSVSERPAAFVDAYEERFERLQQTGSVAALGDLAQFYHANGFLPEAGVVYESLIETDSDDPRWPYLASRIEQDFGRIEEALSLLERSRSLAPQNALLAVRIGELHLKSGAEDKAAFAFDEALEIDGGFVFAKLGRARVAMGREDWGTAADLLQEIIKSEPGLATSYMLLASVLEKQGQAEKAERIRKEGIARDQGRMIEDPWMAALDAHCFDVYRLRVRADFWIKSGRDEKALPLLLRAAQIDPDDGQTHFDLAKYYRSRDDSEAVSRLRRAVELEPRLEAAWHTLVAITLEAGDLGEALGFSSQALQQLPSSASLTRQRGVLMQAVNRWTDAETLFRKAVSLEPNVVENHVALGNFLWARQRLEAAAESYRAAAALSPLAAEPRALLATYYLQKNDFEPALQWLGEAEKADADLEGLGALLGDARARYGNALAKEGKVEAALPLYLAAFQADTTQLQALSNYAALMVRAGKRDALGEQLAKLRDEKPDTAMVYYFLAQLEAMQGRFQAATDWAGRGFEIARRRGDSVAIQQLTPLLQSLKEKR